MMHRMILTAAAFCLLPVFSASAQVRDPGSRAELIGVPPGLVQVDANYLAPDSCRYIGAMRQGAPAGTLIPRHAVALTVVVATGPGPCLRQRTVVRQIGNVFPDLDTVNVVVFFVSPSGQRLKTETIPIAGL